MKKLIQIAITAISFSVFFLLYLYAWLIVFVQAYDDMKTNLFGIAVMYLLVSNVWLVCNTIWYYKRSKN